MHFSKIIGKSTILNSYFTGKPFSPYSCSQIKIKITLAKIKKRWRQISTNNSNSKAFLKINAKKHSPCSELLFLSHPNSGNEKVSEMPVRNSTGVSLHPRFLLITALQLPLCDYTWWQESFFRSSWGRVRVRNLTFSWRFNSSCSSCFLHLQRKAWITETVYFVNTTTPKIQQQRKAEPFWAFTIHRHILQLENKLTNNSIKCTLLAVVLVAHIKYSSCVSQNNKAVMSSPGKTTVVENQYIFICVQSSEIFHTMCQKRAQLIFYFYLIN